jgi:hypothetical protein
MTTRVCSGTQTITPFSPQTLNLTTSRRSSIADNTQRLYESHDTVDPECWTEIGATSDDDTVDRTFRSRSYETQLLTQNKLTQERTLRFARHHRTHSQWSCQENHRAERDYTPEPWRCQVARAACGTTISEAQRHEFNIAGKDGSASPLSSPDSHVWNVE